MNRKYTSGLLHTTWLLTLWAACACIQAQTLPNVNVRITDMSDLLQFKADGSMVQTTLLEREALTDQGAQQLTKHIYQFNGALEKVELLHAYTLKKSGEKVLLAPEALTRQKGSVSAGLGITMPEWEVHQIAYGAVATGDKVVVQTRRTINKPSLPGWHSYNDFLWPAQDLLRGRWRIEAPSGMPLYVHSTMPVSKPVVEQDGLRIWEFEGSMRGKPINQSPTSTRTAVPTLMVSTLERHEDVAALFAQEVNKKASSVPALKTLAQEITASKDGAEDKTRAIYNWIRKNIRYTAIYMANGGWEPHDVEHILKTRYGDCKDHVTLMIAMLREVGVAAEPVLISTWPEYTRDALPVQGSYNHTIVYVPAIQKYVDPTANTIPFDAKNYAIAGRPVARSDGLTSQLDKTPTIKSSDYVSHVKTKIVVNADGSAAMKIDHLRKAMAALAAQDQLEQYKPEFEATEIRRLLTGAGMSGSGRFSHGPIRRDALSQQTNWDLKITNFLEDPMAGSKSVNPGFNIQSHISQIMGGWALENREFGGNCSSYKVIEEFEMQFEDQFQILRIPKGTLIEAPGILFESKHVLKGNTLSGSRIMQFDIDAQECTVAEYAKRQPTMHQISRFLRSPVLFMQKEK